MKKQLVLTYIFVLLLSLVQPLNTAFADGGEETTEITETEETTTVEEDVEEEITVIDDNQTKVTTKYFDLLLIKKSQSAFGGYVPYELQITPHLNSEKTQILWYAPSTMKVTPKHKEFINMKEGVTYTVKANVKALREGTYEITASVIAWKYDTNYTNTIHDTLVFNSSLLSQPVSTQYVLLTIVKFILIVAIFAVVCILIVKLSKKYSRKAKDWLTPPY